MKSQLAKDALITPTRVALAGKSTQTVGKRNEWRKKGERRIGDALMDGSSNKGHWMDEDTGHGMKERVGGWMDVRVGRLKEGQQIRRGVRRERGRRTRQWDRWEQRRIEDGSGDRVDGRVGGRTTN